MRLVSWNVNGLRSVHRKELFVPAVRALDPDILCLQETKADQGQAVIDLPEYTEYWNSSTRKKGYAGTAIFTRIEPLNITNGLPFDIVQKFKLAEDDYGDPNAEGRVMAMEFEKFHLINVYTPNSKPDLSRLTLRHTSWDPAFLAYAVQLQKAKPVIFCGDLNVAHTPEDLTNPKANEGDHGFTEEEREGIDNVLSEGFIDTFRLFTQGSGHYTWWSVFSNARARNVGWRIDYFFASSSLRKKITSARIHADIYGSDHCPVSLDVAM